jgi:hypothetical protein
MAKVCYLPTMGGAYTLVDQEDFERWNPYSWGTDKDGYVCAYFQLGKGKTHLIRLHRLIAVPNTAQFVHHKNHWMLDNRRENLQCVTAARHAALHPENEDLQRTAKRQGTNWRLIHLCRIEKIIRERAADQ